jgi:hypothetical protein
MFAKGLIVHSKLNLTVRISWISKNGPGYITDCRVENQTEHFVNSWIAPEVSIGRCFLLTCQSKSTTNRTEICIVWPHITLINLVYEFKLCLKANLFTIKGHQTQIIDCNNVKLEVHSDLVAMSLARECCNGGVGRGERIVVEIVKSHSTGCRVDGGYIGNCSRDLGIEVKHPLGCLLGRGNR